MDEYIFKPFIIPDGFKLVVDTREQKPMFKNLEGLEIVEKSIKHGDYSIMGFEKVFTVERKMLSDFYSYIGREYDKTMIKINAMRKYKFAGLIIEASEYHLFRKQMFSEYASPEGARQFLAGLNVWGIHSYVNSNRESLERWILDRAIKFYNAQRKI